MPKLKAVASTKSSDLQDLVDVVNQEFDKAGVPTVNMTDLQAAVKNSDEQKFLTRLEKFLDEDFKTSVENGKEEEIRALISKTAIAEYENQLNKKNDIDLQEKKAAAKYAGEQYSDATKIHKARIAYAYYILESRAKV